MGRVGNAAPTAAPMPTDIACTTAVAVVMLGFSFLLLTLISLVERWSKNHEE